jgi:hypothetical protein
VNGQLDASALSQEVFRTAFTLPARGDVEMALDEVAPSAARGFYGALAGSVTFNWAGGMTAYPPDGLPSRSASASDPAATSSALRSRHGSRGLIVDLVPSIRSVDVGPSRTLAECACSGIHNGLLVAGSGTRAKSERRPLRWADWVESRPQGSRGKTPFELFGLSPVGGPCRLQFVVEYCLRSSCRESNAICRN